VAIASLCVLVVTDSSIYPACIFPLMNGLICAYCVVNWVQNFHVISATYDINSFAVTNQYGQIMISVPFFLATKQDWKYTFYIGKGGSITGEFVVLSKFEISELEQYDKFYKITNSIWKAGAVILPKAEYEKMLSFESVME
jgi:hypothetical protein